MLFVSQSFKSFKFSIQFLLVFFICRSDKRSVCCFVKFQMKYFLVCRTKQKQFLLSKTVRIRRRTHKKNTVYIQNTHESQSILSKSEDCKQQNAMRVRQNPSTNYFNSMFAHYAALISYVSSLNIPMCMCSCFF